MAKESFAQGLLQNLLAPQQPQGMSSKDIMAAMSSPNPMAAVMAASVPQTTQAIGQGVRGMIGGITGQTPYSATEAYSKAMQQISQQPGFGTTSASLTAMAQAANAVGKIPEAMQLMAQANEMKKAEQQETIKQNQKSIARQANIRAVQTARDSIDAARYPGLAESLDGYVSQLFSETEPSAPAEIQSTLNSMFDRAKVEVPKPPSSVQEYEYAKQQGFQGTLADWQRLGAPTSLSVGAAPVGYKYVGENGNLRLEVIPGGPADKGKGATDAAKLSLVKTAADNMNELKSMIFNYNNDGSVAGVKRTNIFNANVPSGGTPFTEGRTLNAVLLDTLEAKIRAESGAAVPASEVARLAERFRPSILDSDETIERKMQLLQSFYNNVLSYVKEDGTFDTDAAVLSVASEVTAANDLSSLSDEELIQMMTGQGTPE